MLQDSVLWEHGHEGAERCADIIRHRYGVARTPEAVRRHAYRIGAPMYRYEVCPECGGKFDHLGPDGICHQCRQHELAEGQRRKRDAILAEIRANQSAEERRKAEREYEKERQANSRLRRKYGVPARAKDGSGDSVGIVTQMSNA